MWIEQRNRQINKNVHCIKNSRHACNIWVKVFSACNILYSLRQVVLIARWRRLVPRCLNNLVAVIHETWSLQFQMKCTASSYNISSWHCDEVVYAPSSISGCIKLLYSYGDAPDHRGCEHLFKKGLARELRTKFWANVCSQVWIPRNRIQP